MKIFDGHNDILSKLTKPPGPGNPDGFLESGAGHLDYPRAKDAGFAGGFFAVFASNSSSEPSPDLSDDGYSFPMAPPLEYEFAHDAALKMIDLLHSIEKGSKGKFEIVKDHQSLINCLENDIMAGVLHLEGAEPILPSLENFEYFYDRGMRSLGITWSRPNKFGYGVPFKYPSSPDTGPGLTDAGKKLVKTCNEYGVLIDLAHLNEKGFWDTAEISNAPLVSSHTAACSLVPKARNLTDEQLIAVAETNGVIGIIFSVNDLDGAIRPKKDTAISSILKHIRYIADLIGPEYVAFGSDLDGTIIPSEFGDVSGFPKLVGLMREDGFSASELEMICYKNWLRVLKESWKAA